MPDPSVHPLYFVECDFGRATAFVETDRFKNSKKQIVQDIIEGQCTNVLRVLEVVEDEGTCRDVTEDVARDVAQYVDMELSGVPRHLKDWLDEHCGPGTADRLNAAAGNWDEVYRPERVSA